MSSLKPFQRARLRAVGVFRCRIAPLIGIAPLIVAGAAGLGMGFPAVADAVTAAPGLTVHTVAFQGEFPEGVAHGLQVTVANAGAAGTPGPVVLKDTLPVGFSATVGAFNVLPAVPLVIENSLGPAPFPLLGGGGCSQEGTPAEGVTVTCRYVEAEWENEVTHELELISGLPPDTTLALELSVTATPGAHSGVNTASVSAPGAVPASASGSLLVGSGSLAFGPSGLGSYIAGAGGEPDHQAGDHPYELTTRIDLNSVVRVSPEALEEVPTSVQDVKDVVVDLPAGLVGDAQATPKCTLPELSTKLHCPNDTRVGQIRTEPFGHADAYGPLYNMVPEHGVAAEFGFYDALKATHVFYAGVAPTPSGYVVRATTPEVPQVNLTDVTVTVFGNPAAKDEEKDGETQPPFFTNPSDCGSHQPRVSTVYLDSWQEPGAFNKTDSAAGEPLVQSPHWASTSSAAAESPPVTGCNELRFAASMSAQPDTTTADSPTGLDFDLKVPQAEPKQDVLGTPPLRDATVVMPAGMTVDPSAGNGLQACSEAEIGWLGTTGPDGEALPEVTGPNGKETNTGLTNFTQAAPTCPEASKIGSVEVISPLIENERPLQGSVYLARQTENPFGSLLAAYIVIDDPTTGTIVKVPGKLTLNETPGPDAGQITGVFDQNPQLPFSELKLRFFGGERGDLATPEACGTYTTTSDFEPWSAPESGPDATPSDSFNITGGCVSAFGPAFSAGTVTNQAGSYSPFVLSISKEDDEQGMGGLTVSLPPGLIGKISGVGECSDAQVAAAEARGGLGQGAQELASPSCPGSSLLGTVTTASGPGADPVSVTGKAYLTGPYKGAPYGMAVIVPAIAGPFDLGVVVIRQALFINPVTSQVTDVSDPFPTIRDGIPLRIKRIDVNLNRPEFTLNPTSCEAKAISATATSIPGAQAALSSHFQAAGCSSLAFKPVFSASTQANGTRKGQGASLDVKIGYPQPFTPYANILKVDTSLPLALSSRLTTLQKACTETQFAVNPAGCPPASAVGIATAITPLLPAPLMGPAYLVSHGGRAFPDLDIVLQGNDVTIDLTGNTDIKDGVTYSKFESAPDAPVSSFELNLPEKENSILAAVKNLCAPTKTVTVRKRVAVRRHGKLVKVTKRVASSVPEALIMPTSMTAQNGAVITQNVNVAVTGCAKVKRAKKVTKKRKSKRKK